MILHSVTAGEGPPLAMLHGLFGSARNFGAVQRALGQGEQIGYSNLVDTYPGITVDKGADGKWEIAKGDVKTDAKVGDKVTITYRMTATKVEVKTK